MILLSFWCHSPLSANKHHSTRGWYEVRLIDAVPLFFFHHHGAYVRHQIFVGGPFAPQSAQVVILLAEQAGAQLAIRGQPDARTMSAERLRHRSNEPDLPWRAIRKAVLAGRFAALVRDLMQRTRTAFIFTGASREFCAASMLPKTVAKDFVRVIFSNLDWSRESRLILIRRNPAWMSRSHRSASRWPFVVIDKSSTPSACSRAM